jgi:hypothetical protein
VTQSARNTEEVPVQEIVELLSPALGAAKARMIVEDACGKLRLSLVQVTRHEAQQILEVVAQTPGLVGITARFALSRALLMWC